MNQQLTLVAILTVPLAGCIDTHIGSPTAPDDTIWGSGHLVTQSRPVSGIDSVLLSGAGELVIEHTGSESLTITAEDNIISELTSEVVGGRLILGVKPGVSISPDRPILYRLTVREIDEVGISGAGRVAASGVQSDRFDVLLSGAGTIMISGSVSHQTLTLSGAGRYEAQSLTSRTAAVTLSGAGHATIRVSRRIEGVISGAGILEYYGDPEVAVTVSGSGVIRRLGD